MMKLSVYLLTLPYLYLAGCSSVCFIGLIPRRHITDVLGHLLTIRQY